MTPKQIVLEKWKGAILCDAYKELTGFYKTIVIRNNKGHFVVGYGKTPRQAWAIAAETVRRGK